MCPKHKETKKMTVLHFCHTCRQILSRESHINTCKYRSLFFLRSHWLITVEFEIVCFRWNSTNSKFKIFCLSCLPILCTKKKYFNSLISIIIIFYKTHHWSRSFRLPCTSSLCCCLSHCHHIIHLNQEHCVWQAECSRRVKTEVDVLLSM